MLKTFLTKITKNLKPSEIIVRNLNQYRTHYCNELSINDVGKQVEICGWIQSIRLNKFLIVRDFYDTLQVFLPDSAFTESIKNLSLESVVKITGIVRERPSGNENKKLNTGLIEIECKTLNVLNTANANLPFQLSDFNRANEAIRLKYRYLDLRTKQLQENLKLRSNFVSSVRSFLDKNKFLDIETPTLFRRTPGGAREFLVPTRYDKKFFSLTQSPQQFKQLLMMGGFDRYYQIARCYRDEEMKSDRQPEFTQIDIEMSFVNEENIIELIESLLSACWPIPGLKVPFQRITYNDAMRLYGTDKPDLRFDLKFTNLTNAFRNSQCGIGKIDSISSNIHAYAFKVPFSLCENENALNVDKLASIFKDLQKEINSPNEICVILKGKQGTHLTKHMTSEFKDKLNEILQVDNEAVFIVLSQNEAKTLSTLGRYRLSVADYIDTININKQKPLLRDPNKYAFEWVVDFPLFTLNEDTNKYESTHHPFTAPKEQHLNLIQENCDLNKILGQHYDLVLNGNEIAGGSIRIHNSKLQRFIIKNILNEDTNVLDHLIEALDYGAPPHGGIAFGLDRLIAIICKANSIREVIAFPKSSNGKDLMSDAPSSVSQAELDFYKIKLID